MKTFFENLLRYIYDLLKNPAIQAVFTIGSYLVTVLSPTKDSPFIFIFVTILVVIVIWGHTGEKKDEQQEPTNQPTAKLDLLKPKQYSKKGAPFITIMLFAILLFATFQSLVSKNSNIYAFLFNRWADQIVVVPTQGEKPLLSITHLGLMHDLFEIIKPVLHYDSKTSKVFLTFEPEKETYTINIANMGLDEPNLVYEPAAKYFINSYEVKDYAFTNSSKQFDIQEKDTLIISIFSSKSEIFARLHMEDFVYDVYGHLTSIKIYVACLKDGSQHFEGLTQP